MFWREKPKSEQKLKSMRLHSNDQVCTEDLKVILDKSNEETTWRNTVHNFKIKQIYLWKNKGS